MNRLDRDLDALFQAYREAVTAPEAGANFMPRLWGKIDRRRSVVFQFKRLTQVFLAGAAAMCLLLAGVAVIPHSPKATAHASYLDVLAEAHPTENLLAQGIAHTDLPEAGH